MGCLVPSAAAAGAVFLVGHGRWAFGSVGCGSALAAATGVVLRTFLVGRGLGGHLVPSAAATGVVLRTFLVGRGLGGHLVPSAAASGLVLRTFWRFLRGRLRRLSWAVWGHLWRGPYQNQVE